MPWSMKDYPASLKNLEKPVKKKAIEIANAMIDEGYEDGRAIPIATSKAKEWVENASKKEIDDFLKHDDETERDEEANDDARPELMNKAEHVIKHKNGWAVKAEDAKRVSEIKETKTEAIERAKEIAEHKGTDVIVHLADGSVQRKIKTDS
ncbi:DUF2188 domain-containing protein [Bacillus mojavensis]|uniref:DUF2188 domain-containing protein n=1 Tax=Bacillus mojavensis TaxID=72360 RepID=A0AAP3CN69_BACMO|nr:DUF2188 domain-containing protein [Bacillus mojavensis]MCY8105473.1 DUF2188 domain-containing protein [Bacillus mojavensis]MCY8481886.1 DUF2188 domain-containing protein [Bacillus mojavensis]MCY8508247.1 DUF2188 domain-containing protein [Bacillus mojavensis]MCY9187640.1 DUF2188 domain-containing protein [Bacillus mojavensis]MEC1776043.1 DUF2188 domain-containing protein [Bacillus mojavensis]